jgi:membrane protease YdiL (CAAX protease family)
LLISVFICIYAGSIAGTVVQHLRGGNTNPAFLWIAVGGAAALATAMVLVRLPITFENLKRRIGMAALCFYAGLLLGAWAQHIGGAARPSVVAMIISALSFQGAAILLVALFLKEHNAGWTSSFGWDRGAAKAILVGVALGLAFLPIGWVLQSLTATLMEHMPLLRMKPQEQQAVQTLRMATAFWHKVTLAITTIGLAPVAEELLFRGVLYNWIRKAGFPKFALWGISFVFAAIHLNLLIFLPLFLLSLLLTVLYERTSNLLAPIFAHMAFNAANFGLLHLIEQGTKYSP